MAAVPPPGQRAAPGQVWGPGPPVVGTAVAAPASHTASLPAPRWRGAAAAVADRAAASASLDGGGAVGAGQLPVWVGATSPAQVGVRVADQTAASAAGVKGMLLQVWRADGGLTGGSS